MAVQDTFDALEGFIDKQNPIRVVKEIHHVYVYCDSNGQPQKVRTKLRMYVCGSGFRLHMVSRKRTKMGFGLMA